MEIKEAIAKASQNKNYSYCELKFDHMCYETNQVYVRVNELFTRKHRLFLRRALRKKFNKHILVGIKRCKSTTVVSSESKLIS